MNEIIPNANPNLYLVEMAGYWNETEVGDGPYPIIGWDNGEPVTSARRSRPSEEMDAGDPSLSRISRVMIYDRLTQEYSPAGGWGVWTLSEVYDLSRLEKRLKFLCRTKIQKAMEKSLGGCFGRVDSLLALYEKWGLQGLEPLQWAVLCAVMQWDYEGAVPIEKVAKYARRIRLKILPRVVREVSVSA